jgi:hypothetical protein
MTIQERIAHVLWEHKLFVLYSPDINAIFVRGDYYFSTNDVEKILEENKLDFLYIAEIPHSVMIALK